MLTNRLGITPVIFETQLANCTIQILVRVEGGVGGLRGPAGMGLGRGIGGYACKTPINTYLTATYIPYIVVACVYHHKSMLWFT